MAEARGKGMMTRKTSAAAMVMLAAGCMLGAADEPLRQVTTEQLARGEIQLTGQTGKRIGEYCTIEGKAPERPIMMDNPLSVEQVDGKKLGKPFLLTVRGTDTFVPGSRQILRGYENCGMTGTPADPKEEQASLVQQPLHFGSWFEATKVLTPKEAGQ